MLLNKDLKPKVTFISLLVLYLNMNFKLFLIKILEFHRDFDCHYFLI